MKILKYVVEEPVGIHARPAGQLAKELNSYTSTIYMEAHGKKISPKGPISIIGLAVRCGQEVTFELEGIDEEIEVSKLQNFCEKYL